MTIDRLSLPGTIQTDMVYMLLEDRLGTGVARDVFTTRLSEDWVIKIEFSKGGFQNVREWLLWERLKDTTMAKWLAPCLSISDGGAVLVQRKTSPATKYPQQLPRFLTDTKKGNYGMLDGRFVAHDYGVNLAEEWGINAMQKLRKVEWL